jgi:hypothetical protein
MGDSMITPSIEYDYLIKFLALGDSGVGKNEYGLFFNIKTFFLIRENNISLSIYRWTI